MSEHQSSRKETLARTVLSGLAAVTLSQTIAHEPNPQVGPNSKAHEVVNADPYKGAREKIAAEMFKGEVAEVHDTGKIFLDKMSPRRVPDHNGKFGPPLRNEVDVTLYLKRNDAVNALAQSHEYPRGPVRVEDSGVMAYILGDADRLALIVPTKDPRKDAYSEDSLSFTVTPYASWPVGTRIVFASGVRIAMSNGSKVQEINADEVVPGGMIKTKDGWVAKPDIIVKPSRSLSEEGLYIRTPMPALQRAAN